MKKIVLLCLAHERDETLRRLARIGAVHLTSAREPRGDGLTSSRQALEMARTALAVLESYAKAAAKSHGVAPARDSAPNIADLPARVVELDAARKGAQERRDEASREVAALLPYGDFDPAVAAALREQGVRVDLIRLPEGRSLDLPADVVSMPLGSEARGRLAVLISAGAIACDAERVAPPKRSLLAAREAVAAAERDLSAAEEELALLCRHVEALRAHADEWTERVAFQEARAGMGESESVAYLQGYCPIDRVETLRAAANEEGWGLLLEDPAPDDAVPTLIHYPLLVRPIKAVLEALRILPGYREADIGAVFLPFFSVFFAMLIGDAGYGALILIGTLLMRRRFPSAPAYVFALFYLLSGCTIAWGLATGSVFGIAGLPAPLRALQVPWLANRDNVMKLCFFLGAVHLSIAHAWNAVTIFPNRKFLAQLGWVLLVWFMFFGACRMVLGESMPALAPVLFAVALAAIALFMTPPREFKQNWIDHAMLPLNLVSAFVDVVSYVRLFAVGMAALAVAQSFNGMAHAVGMNRVWALPLSAAILLIGHGLNIALAALGVLVHGVRLNTLEFSLHKNMQWSGRPYAPFRATDGGK